MKRFLKIRTLTMLLLILIANVSIAQHFTTVWSGNPYQSMAFIIQSATIDGVNMEAGDEIAVFDIDGNGAEICVGTVVLTGTVTSGASATFAAAHEELGGDGFITGNTILYKLWDNSESTEITMVVPTYFGPPFDEVYAPQGTALVTSIAGSSSVETAATSVTTCQGGVTVPVAVSNVNDVTEFTLIMDYGTTNLTYTGYQNVNAQLNSGALSVTESGGEITVTWNSSTAANITSGTLLEFLFTASTVYTQTQENLTWDESNSYYQDSNGNTLVASFTNGIVTIDPVPVDAGAITGTTPVCQGTVGEAYQVGTITNATSYIWELLPTTAGIINGSGTSITIDYSATFSGTATLSVYGSNTCGDGNPSSLPITVNGHPTVNAGSDAAICEDANYTLSGTATDQQSVLWTTAGDGSFDDATLLAATYTPGTNDISTGTVILTLTAYALSPCSPDVSDNMTITIQPLPTAGAGSDVTICEDATHTLSGTATNQQSILWTTSGDGTFDDATLLAATYTPGTNDITSGSATLTITAYAITPCGTDATDDVIITIQNSPVVSAGADAIICEDATYTLSGTATDQQSVLWTTSGDGTFDDATLLAATYTPGANDISSASVVLTITAYAITPCGTDATDNMTLSIQYQPATNAGTDATICENNTYTLSGTATNQQSILWTTSGDGTFDDATLLAATYTPGISDIATGNATLTITAFAITPCGTDATDDMILSITPLPLVDAGADETICETNPVYTLSGTASNQQSILWTTSGDGTFDDATLLAATYTAGTNDLLSGSVTLTITAYPNAPCATNVIDDMVLTYAPLPVSNAGPDDEICLNTPSYQVTGASATDYTDLLWTTSGDGTFDDATILDPIYTPGTIDRANGTVDLTLTASSVALCVDDDTMTLTFAVLPTADAGDDADICENNTYQLSGTATDYSSIQWTTDGDGTFDDATSLTAIYTPGATDITNGTANLTLTAFASFPCVDDTTDTMTLTIVLLPYVDAGVDDTICENISGYETNAIASGGISSILWETTGDGTFDDTTIVNATYYPGTGDIANEGVNLILNANPSAPCATSVSDTMYLMIQPLPTSNAGDDAEICENDNYTLSGSATNYDHVYWATSGDGTFDDAFLLNATYTPGADDINNGSVTLTMFAYSISPCFNEVSDAMILTINSSPSANAGEDAEVCANEPYLLDGSAENYESTQWTTSGDGTFDDATLLNATYTPGENDMETGTVNLTLTANAMAPCTSDATDEMELGITPMPDQPLLPDGPVNIDLDVTSTSEYTTNQTANATSYQWNLEPMEAGTISGDDTIGTVDWNSDYVGLVAYIHVIAINDCGGVSSDTLPIDVSPVGINNLSGNEPSITIAPNPSNGRFTITINGTTDDIDMVIINNSGQVIQKKKLINTIGNATLSIDISTQPNGTYYLKFITKHGVMYKKVLMSNRF